jgi:glycerate kinase
MLLKDRICIITGAGSLRGLGRATGALFATHGAKIAVLDIDLAAAREAAASLPGRGHLALKCDVTKRKECEKATARVIARHGRVDVLINNAGVTAPERLMEVSDALYNRIMDINMRGCFHMTQAVVAYMRVARQGSIINMSSVSAQRGGGVFGGTPYAAAKGAKRVRIGIGGSATNEGGIGLAQALGFRFLNERGEEVANLPERFEEVVRIERPLVALNWPEVEVACDVDNPLLGERGATRVYGRQKGVTAATEALFEARLEKLAAMVQRDLGVDPREVPGAGAAGGLGFGLMAFCGARLVGGFDLVAEVVGLRERVSKVDVVITGEGRMDAQTLCGKGPVGVARMARGMGKRVVGIAGGVEQGVGLEAEFDLLVATKPEAMPLAEAMARGAGLIEETVVRLADVLREW